MKTNALKTPTNRRLELEKRINNIEQAIDEQMKMIDGVSVYTFHRRYERKLNMVIRLTFPDTKLEIGSSALEEIARIVRAELQKQEKTGVTS